MFEKSLNDLSEEDAVRVYLLYLLDKGFNGRLKKQHVLEEYFSLLSNIDEIKKYHVAIL